MGKGQEERQTAWVNKVFIRLETDRVGRDRRDYHRAWLGQECIHTHTTIIDNKVGHIRWQMKVSTRADAQPDRR